MNGSKLMLERGAMLAHYERGAVVRPQELEQAAAAAGLTGKQLRSIMPPRGRAVWH